MSPRVDPLDTGVSPTQVRVDYITVRRELLSGTLRSLMAFLPRCKRKGCKSVALYKAHGRGRVPPGVFNRSTPVCSDHATDDDKTRCIDGADWILVAFQLMREAGE